MTKVNVLLGSALFLLGACILAFSLITFNTHKSFGNSISGGSDAAACTFITVIPVTVGNQAATTVLGAQAMRAWASIQLPLNATNTISVSLASTSAVSGKGIQLSGTPTSSPSSVLTFGLNTPLPYAGPVSVITSAATTTILVNECTY